MHIWLPEHLQAVDHAQCWDDCVKVGHRELERISPHGPVGLVSGAMTSGYRSFETNMRIFDTVIRRAQEEGLCVFNQLPLQQPIIRLTNHHAGGGYRYDILHDLYAHIFGGGDIDYLIMIPGWEASVGARWEYEFAQLIGIEIRHAPLSWVMEQRVIPEPQVWLLAA